MSAEASTSTPVRTVSLSQQVSLDRLVRARSAGNPAAIRAAEHEVIVEHLGFAAALASRYNGRGVDREDLQQLARLGLVKAVKRWRPDVGADFLPFAHPTILGEIRRFFRDQSTMIRAPRGLRELNFEISTAARFFEQQHGRAAGDGELAAAVGVTVAQVEQQRAAITNSRTLSLSSEAVQTVVDRLANPDAAADLGRAENLLLLERALATRTARERQILALRFFHDRSQTEIAAAVGVSQMQISRILSKSLRDLRAFIACDN